MVWLRTQYPRAALYNGCNIQENLLGDTSVGDELTLHRQEDLYAVQGWDTSVRDSSSKGRIIHWNASSKGHIVHRTHCPRNGEQPRLFFRGHIGRGHFITPSNALENNLSFPSCSTVFARENFPRRCNFLLKFCVAFPAKTGKKYLYCCTIVVGDTFEVTVHTVPIHIRLERF
jgi:hypothetical protein